MRSVFRGRVRWTFPHTVVADSPDRVVLSLQPGVEGRWVPRTADGHDIRAWGSAIEPSPHVWETTRVLWTTRFGAAHSLGLFWDDASGDFLGWYCNLQEPLRRSPLGFDTLDHALDVWIEPDGTWRWKDEDDLAGCVALELFSEARGGCDPRRGRAGDRRPLRPAADRLGGSGAPGPGLGAS